MIKHYFRTILGPIPDDWDTFQLGPCVSKNSAGDWGEDSGEVQVLVLRSTNFSNSRALDLTDVPLRGFSAQAAQKFDLRKGDVLLERSGGGPTQPVGRVVVLAEDMPGFGYSNFVQQLRINSPELVPDYAAWLLYYLHASGTIERLQHQTTQMRNLEFRDYLRIQLPKPPKREQEAIVSVITEADRGVVSALKELDAAKSLKTSLLQQLFAYGLPGRHQEFNETALGRLPATWCIRTIGSILAEPPFSGVSPQSAPEPPGTPILNVSCVKIGRCDPTLVTYVQVDQETIDECRAAKGDFYVLRGNGNREFVASGGLLDVEPPTDCIFSDKLIRLRFNQDVVEGFMPLLWQSNTFLRRLQSKAESGSGLWMMSKRDIRREVFPCPSKAEQQEIVDVVQESQALIDALETMLAQQERLKASLLQNLLLGRVRLKVAAVA